MKEFVVEDGVLLRYCGKGGDVTVPTGVTAIGDSAFYSLRSVTSVTIPEGVTRIGDHAFAECRRLTEVRIPDSVTVIEPCAFFCCSELSSVRIPDGVQVIETAAFSHCYLREIKIPDSVTRIEREAFCGCGYVKELVIPDGVTSIGVGAFDSCFRMISVRLPKGLTSLGEEAFKDCTALREVTIPEGVTRIERATFEDCGDLRAVNLPESVTEIGESAFCRCRRLCRVTMRGKMRRIDAYAFETCWSFRTFEGDVPEYVSPKAFTDCPNPPVWFLRFTDEPEDKRKTAWVYLADPDREENAEADAFVKMDRAYLLKECARQEDVSVFRVMTEELGVLFSREELDEAISLAKGRVAVLSVLLDYRHRYYPEEEEKGDESVFEDAAPDPPGESIAERMREFDYWETEDGYEITAYKGESEVVVIPDGVTVIAPHAFRNKFTLDRIVIPVSTTKICSRAFSGCSKLTAFEFCGTVRQWYCMEREKGWVVNEVPVYIVKCTDDTLLIERRKL